MFFAAFAASPREISFLILALALPGEAGILLVSPAGCKEQRFPLDLIV
jgi:hypothetical protein